MMPDSPKRFLPTYLFLSFAISWAIWIPIAISGRDYHSSPFLLTATLVGAFGPGLAAIVINYIERDIEKISESYGLVTEEISSCLEMIIEILGTEKIAQLEKDIEDMEDIPMRFGLLEPGKDKGRK